MAKKKVTKKKAVKKAVKKKTAKKITKKTAKKSAPKKAKAKKTVKKVAKKKVAKKAVKKSARPAGGSAPKKAAVKKNTIIKVKRPRIINSPVVVHTSINPSSHSAIENLVHSSSDSNHSSNHTDNQSTDNSSESTQESSKDSSDSGSDSSEEKSDGERIVPHCTRLKEGDVAPYFEGINQFGNSVKSSDFSKTTLILYFYPKDFTGGCTAESCSLRDEYNYLENNSYTVVGVSADTVDSHRRFSAELSLPFSLIADVDMKMIKAFDVWGMKKSGEKFSGGIVRTTFVIGPDGKIKNIITKVDSENAAQQILSL